MKKALALVLLALATAVGAAHAQQQPSPECNLKGTDFCRSTGGVPPGGD